MEDCLSCPSGLYTLWALLRRTIIVKETGRTPLSQSVGSFRRKTSFTDFFDQVHSMSHGCLRFDVREVIRKAEYVGH